MNPKKNNNNVFNGMNTTTSGSVFNGMGPAPASQPGQPGQPSQPSAPSSSAPEPQFNQPQPSDNQPQPFFGFGGENDNNNSSTNTIPQMPQNQGVFTPTQPIAPANPNAPQPAPKLQKAPSTPEQTIKKFTILSIVLGVAAVVFLFLGIWGLVDAISTRTKLADANQNLSTYSSIVAELEKQTGTTINVVEDLPVYQPASGYVYITGWDIKLKIPDTLTSVSYILNQNADYHSYICFAAVQQGVQYFPAFADINQNKNGIGCLYRIPVTDGEKDGNGNSYGQNIFTSGDYNYFYKETPLFSASEADKGLETTARDLVKQMIVENISTYQ